MPVTISEGWASRSSSINSDNASVNVLYLVNGTDDDTAVLAAVVAGAPATWTVSAGLTLVKDTINYDRISHTSWVASVRYAQFPKTERTDTSTIYNFEIGTETAHITQSKETVARYNTLGIHNPPTNNVADFKGAIGVTSDGVDGCDILIGSVNFSETRYIAKSLITGAWKLNLAQLAGKWNNASFKGFAAKEVQFLGCSGSQRGNENLEITFKFRAVPNVTGLTIGDITGIDKKGAEYIWVRYQEQLDPDSNTIVRRPKNVHVERVYDYADFSLIGIGTT